MNVPIPLLTLVAALAAGPEADLRPPQLIATAVAQLLDMQEDGGAWPYEGVYRVGGEIPIGYRVGGTALVSQALLHASTVADDKVDAALQRGLTFILAGLDDPLMAPSRQDAYDVRVWGHACALEYLCQLRTSGRLAAHDQEIGRRIRSLVGALIFEELDGGGWNYAGRKHHAAFVTGVVTQALLNAAVVGEAVPPEVFLRARDILLASRVDTGAFFYSGSGSGRPNSRAEVPGSIGRSPLCETTLQLLGHASEASIAQSIDQFFEHWNELEKRRKQHGTHVPPYGIAPYYFYFAHRYVAQGIELLPPARRDEQRERLLDRLLATRDADGTWNDRVFPRSRNYGTAMAVLALLRERVPIPVPVGLRLPPVPEPTPDPTPPSEGKPAPSGAMP